MIIQIALLTSLVVPLGAIAVSAQTTDPTQMAHLAASNQLGVLEYCQSNGWTDQAAVDAQKKSIAALPATTDTSGAAAAEATGKQGTFLTNGNQITLAQMASAKTTSVAAICKQFGNAERSAAASMPSMPGGMPSIPGGMPSMPNGMQMPSMPGAPSTAQ
jgi:hypothetical protein